MGVVGALPMVCGWPYFGSLPLQDNVDVGLSTAPPPTRSTRLEIEGIGGPHTPNKGDKMTTRLGQIGIGLGIIGKEMKEIGRQDSFFDWDD